MVIVTDGSARPDAERTRGRDHRKLRASGLQGRAPRLLPKSLRRSSVPNTASPRRSAFLAQPLREDRQHEIAYAKKTRVQNRLYFRLRTLFSIGLFVFVFFRFSICSVGRCRLSRPRYPLASFRSAVLCKPSRRRPAAQWRQRSPARCCRPKLPSRLYT